MQGVIDAIATWSGAGVNVVTAVMGAVAGAVVIGVGVFVKNRVQKRRRGYYR
jgi:hypothetical protein